MITTSTEAFRAEVRDWLAERTPPAVADASHPDRGPLAWGGRRARIADPEVATWFKEVTARGWATPGWRVEHGGAGLAAEEAAGVRDELARVGAGYVLKNFGTLMVGPLICEAGTEEQRRAHLPAIARGEIAWCLGYSEPDHGSDLAGLQCRAVRDGDDYIVTGTKVWSSRAHKSDFCELLVRTDTSAPKHHGISVLLVDLASPGVSVSPIELISGSSDFCQTVFDEVRVPAANRLGAENAGWGLVQLALRVERQAVVEMAMADHGFTGRRRPSLAELARAARRDGEPFPSDVAAQVAAAEIDQLAFRAAQRRAADAVRSGRDGLHPSVLKYAGARITQRRRDLEMALLGASGLGWEGDGFSDEDLRAGREWLRAFGLSIEGGTSEIQLNILARRVLGLA